MEYPAILLQLHFVSTDMLKPQDSGVIAPLEVKSISVEPILPIQWWNDKSGQGTAIEIKIY